MREGRVLAFVLRVTVLFNLVSCVLVLFIGKTFQSSFFTCRASEGKEHEITTYILDSSRRPINRSCWFRSGYDENLHVTSFFTIVFIVMVAGSHFVWSSLSRISAIDRAIRSQNEGQEEAEANDDRDEATVVEVLRQTVRKISQEPAGTSDDEDNSPDASIQSSLTKVLVYYFIKTAIQLVLAYFFTLNTVWTEWGWKRLWLGHTKWCWIPRAVTKLGLECRPTPLGRTIGFFMVTSGTLSFVLTMFLGTYMVYLPVMLYAKISTVRRDLEKCGVTGTWQMLAFLFYIWLGMSSDEINARSFEHGALGLEEVQTSSASDEVSEKVAFIQEMPESYEADEENSTGEKAESKIIITEQQTADC